MSLTQINTNSGGGVSVHIPDLRCKFARGPLICLAVQHVNKTGITLIRHSFNTSPTLVQNSTHTCITLVQQSGNTQPSLVQHSFITCSKFDQRTFKIDYKTSNTLPTPIHLSINTPQNHLKLAQHASKSIKNPFNTSLNHPQHSCVFKPV